MSNKDNDCTFCLCIACDICHTGYGTNSITVGDTKYIFACDGCKAKLEKTSEKLARLENKKRKQTNPKLG